MQPSSNEAGIGFLRVEVETAAAFARIARHAEDPEKRLRNVRNARKGFDTLLHFMQTLPLTLAERDEMHLKISELRRQLINLGEDV